MSSTIRSTEAIQVLDSRGNPTVSVRVQLDDGSLGLASVPSGASTGEFEAVELRDGDKSCYRGKGVTQAVRNVNETIQTALKGQLATEQEKIDRLLLEVMPSPPPAQDYWPELSRYFPP